MEPGGVGARPHPSSVPPPQLCFSTQNWSSGNVMISLKTICSIQGVRFLLSNDSRSTMKQDRFSLSLNNCLLMRTQLSITDSMDTVKISKRFACSNELSKWNFGKLEQGYPLGLVYDVPPPYSPFPWVSNRSAAFLRLPVHLPWVEASIWNGWRYRDFGRYR